MLWNYLIIAARHIWKEKSFSLINILGLSLGMAFTIIVLLWIQDELSYDKFHKNHKRVYHTYLRILDAKSSFNFQPTTSPEIGSAMLDEIPEITRMGRMSSLGEIACQAGENVFVEDGGLGADTEIFSILSYTFLQGSPENALEEVYSILLTEKMAHKYFGDTDAIGKTIRINDRVELSVTAVIRDVPRNTHRPFDFLVPFKLSSELGIDIDETGNLYSNCSFHTYVMLDENADHEAVKRKVREQFSFDNDIRGETFLVGLPQTNRFSLVGGNLLIYLFLVLGILVLIIACINYINLSTAKATLRTKEVGIRKVFGASNGNLFRQFMGESFLYALVSLNFAIIMVVLFIPVLNMLTGKEIILNYLDPGWIAILFSIWVFTSFLSGIYPSIILASKLPVRIFSHSRSAGSSRSGMRVALVVTQFVFATLFLISIVVVNRQFFYMDHTEKGYNTEDLLYLRLRDYSRESSEILKTELQRIPGITGISNTSHLPVLIAGGYYQAWGRSDEEARYLAEAAVDYDYLTTLGVQMESGRFYSREFPGDSSSSVVVNETAIKTLGWEDPLGKQFFYRGKNHTIIGIMKDFHHVPLFMKISPLIFTLQPKSNDYLLVRLNRSRDDEMKSILKKLESTWERTFPELPLEYNFIEDYQFPQERAIITAERLMWYLTILSILISSMGLYGLSTFMAQRKNREIGIRKVMGAGNGQLVSIYAREYLKIILLSTAISWPLGWLLMKKFLDVFAYRIDLSIWIFIGTGLFICLLVITTVGFLAWRSTLQNPVDTLRHQ